MPVPRLGEACGVTYKEECAVRIRVSTQPEGHRAEVRSCALRNLASPCERSISFSDGVFRNIQFASVSELQREAEKTERRIGTQHSPIPRREAGEGAGEKSS